MLTRTPSKAVECVVRAPALAGRSPVWAPQEQALYWADLAGHKVHRLHPPSGVRETFHLPQPVTAVALRARGGLLLTLRKNYAFYDLQTQAVQYLTDLEPDRPEHRFGDGKCDSRGRFWAGTVPAAPGEIAPGGLYRFDPDTHVTCAFWEVAGPGGLGWSPDDRVMYLTERFGDGIVAYEFDADEGRLAERRPFAALDEDSTAYPDGLAVDADGCVWSAQNGAGRVVRYTPAGEVDAVIELPVPRPCGCTFGGDKLDVLFITTAREPLAPEEVEEAPLSGCVFAVRPGVVGLPEPSFAG